MRQSRVLIQGVVACSAAALAATALAGPASSAGQQSTQAASPESYLVLTTSASGADSVAAKLHSQGAKVTSVNQDVGMVVVTSDDADFRERAAAVAGVEGVAAERVIGRSPARDKAVVEQENLRAAKSGTKVTNKAPAKRRGGAGQAAAAAAGDPLDNNLWGMRLIKADQAHTRTLGNRRVKVGIMDTGVQADHPDLHGNFDYQASRNFTTDIPDVDGPCESPNSCVDPARTAATSSQARRSTRSPTPVTPASTS